MRCRRMLAVLAGLGLLVFPASSPALQALGPDPAVQDWKAWPFQAGCYSTFSPVEVFSRPATAELGPEPAQAALRQIVATQSFPRLPEHRWRSVTETQTEAVFVHGRLSSPLDPLWVHMEHTVEGWIWSGSGTCSPSTIVHGLQAVTWTLAEGHTPLDPRTRRIEVNLGPGPCASGMSQNKRARKPVFRQFGKRLVMVVLLEPLPPGFYSCQAIVEPPLKVKLPWPLGNRKLFDGGAFPPQVALPADSYERSAFLRQ